MFPLSPSSSLPQLRPVVFVIEGGYCCYWRSSGREIEWEQKIRNEKRGKLLNGCKELLAFFPPSQLVTEMPSEAFLESRNQSEVQTNSHLLFKKRERKSWMEVNLFRLISDLKSHSFLTQSIYMAIKYPIFGLQFFSFNFQCPVKNTSLIQRAEFRQQSARYKRDKFDSQNRGYKIPNKHRSGTQ